MQTVRRQCIACTRPSQQTKALNRDDQLLVEPAVVGFLAHLRRSDALGQPFRDFMLPQVESEGFECAQHRAEQVAQGVQAARQVIIDQHQLAAGLEHPVGFAQGLAARRRRLLVQQVESC